MKSTVSLHLLQSRDRERARTREALRVEARTRLREALSALVPGEDVYVFGSVTQPGRFHADSDIDIAFAHEPRATTGYQLSSMIEERVGRPVDLVQLGESRFREKILKEGEKWIA